MFADLQDAMDWGLNRLGGNSFRIKYISIARVESDGEEANEEPATYGEPEDGELPTGTGFAS